MGVTYLLNSANSSGSAPASIEEPPTVQHSTFPRSIPDYDLATVAEDSATHSSTHLNVGDLEDVDPPPYVDRARMHRMYNISSADMDTVRAMVEGRNPNAPATLQQHSRQASVVTPPLAPVIVEEEEDDDIDEDQADSLDYGNYRPLLILEEDLLKKVKHRTRAFNGVHDAAWVGIIAGCSVGALVGSLVTLVWVSQWGKSGV